MPATRPLTNWLAPASRTRRRRSGRVRLLLEELEKREVPTVGVVYNQSRFVDESNPRHSAALLFSGGAGSGGGSFAVTDTDVNGPYTAEFVTTNGSLTFDPSVFLSALTFVSADASNTAVVYSGTLAQINQFLTNGSFRFTPTEFYSGSTGVTLKVTSQADSDAGQATIPVDVYPKADAPTLGVGPSASARVDVGIPLGITSAPYDPDGSEYVFRYDVLNVPGGAYFTKAGGTDPIGTDNNDGTFTFIVNYPGLSSGPLDPADVAGLEIHLPYSGSYLLFVSATAADTVLFAGQSNLYLDYASTVPNQRPPIVVAAIDPPQVYAPYAPSGYQEYQENSVGNTLQDFSSPGYFTVFDGVAQDSDYYTVVLHADHGTLALGPPPVGAGIDISDPVVSDGGHTLTITGNFLNSFFSDYIANGTLTYTPDTYYSGGDGITLTLTAPDGSRGSDTTTVFVAPVAQTPDLSATISGTPFRAGDEIPLDLTAALVDVDSEYFDYVRVYTPGLTGTVTFSAGTDSGLGYWDLTGADLAGLTFGVTAPGTYNWYAEARTIDEALDLRGGGEESFRGPITAFGGGFVTSAPSAPATAPFSFRVTQAPSVSSPYVGDINEFLATPFDHEVSDPPTFVVFTGPSVSGSALFAVTDADDDGESEYTVTLTAFDESGNVMPGTLVANAPNSVVDPSSNATRLVLKGTLGSINSFLDSTGFTYTPTAFYSGQTFVTLDVTDPDGLTGAGTSNVFVSPIADPPPIATQPARGSAGEAIPLDIAVSLLDTDGSEFVAGSVSIDGVPSGAVFTNAAGDAVGSLDQTGIWYFSPDELVGLRINVPSYAAGSYSLEIRASTGDVAYYPLFGVDASDYSADTVAALELTATAPPQVYAGGPEVVVVGPTPTNAVTLYPYIYDPNAPAPDASVVPATDYVMVVTSPNGRFDVLEQLLEEEYGVNVEGNGTGTLTLSGDYYDLQYVLGNGEVAFTPVAGFGGDAPVTFSLTTPDGRFGQDDMIVEVVAFKNLAGNEGGVIPAGVESGYADSEYDYATFRILGVPAGVTLSAGTFDADTGEWLLTTDQLVGLAAFTPQDTNGLPVELTAVADFFYREFSSGGASFAAFDIGPSESEGFGQYQEDIATFFLTVQNVPPQLSGQTQSVAAQPGTTATIDFGSFADPGAEGQWAVQINWGDGTVENRMVNAPGALGTGSHVYATAGVFNVVLSVSDDDATAQGLTGVTIESPASPPPTSPPRTTPPPPPPTVPLTPPVSFFPPPPPDGFEAPPGGPDSPDAPPTPETVAQLSPGAAFGFIPGSSEVETRLPADANGDFPAPGGGAFSGGPTAPQTFPFEKEKDPPLTVLPIDPTTPAGVFGEPTGELGLDQLKTVLDGDNLKFAEDEKKSKTAAATGAVLTPAPPPTTTPPPAAVPPAPASGPRSAAPPAGPEEFGAAVPPAASTDDDPAPPPALIGVVPAAVLLGGVAAELKARARRRATTPPTTPATREDE